MSLLPDVYQRARDEGRKHPEASTLSFMWGAVEDQILEAWVEFVREEPAPAVSTRGSAGASSWHMQRTFVAGAGERGIDVTLLGSDPCGVAARLTRRTRQGTSPCTSMAYA